MKIYKYFVSYVARREQGKGDNIFGCCDVDVKEPIRKGNLMVVIKTIIKNLEDEEGLRDLIILNFKEVI